MKKLSLTTLLLILCAGNAPAIPQSADPDTGDYDEIRQLCLRLEEQRRDSLEAARIAAGLTPNPTLTDQYSRRTIYPALPKVFGEVRSLKTLSLPEVRYVFRMKASDPAQAGRYAGILYSEPTHIDDLEEGDEFLSIASNDTLITTPRQPVEWPEEDQTDEEAIWEAYIEPWTYETPYWLTVARRRQQMEADMQYRLMVENPLDVDYLSWKLPKAPKLKDDKMSYSEFILSQFLPPVDSSDAVLPETEQRKVHWLHNVATGLQFSQAFISSNWYQGGNDHLALLFNFNWDVALNTVYHPNLMFTSSLAYKLAVNSNPKESLHRYSIAQDLLQYNLKAGVKAFRKWFYSYTLQFKTQIFNAFPVDSPDLGAAFLSPGDLNMGLGMTYATEALKGKMKLSASISPISYNLKTCINDKIDPTQFNIALGRHTRSEIGSTGELTLLWDITPNINWKSRLFLFTDYHYFQADWENTFTFNINRFLSTQLYVHPRFDSSTDYGNSSWHYWQLKEILSFGLSYSFSTAP